MIKRILIILIIIASFTSCLTTASKIEKEEVEITGNYDLKLIPTQLDFNVLLYIPGIPVGVSSVIQNNLSDIYIKSNDSQDFTIKGFNSTNLLEAIKSDNSTYSYYGTKYYLNELGLKKIEKLSKSGKTSLQAILETLTEEDITEEDFGNSTPPSLNEFSYMRVAYVYNIIVNDSENKEYTLQVCTENIYDSEDINLQ